MRPDVDAAIERLREWNAASKVDRWSTDTGDLHNLLDDANDAIDTLGDLLDHLTARCEHLHAVAVAHGATDDELRGPAAAGARRGPHQPDRRRRRDVMSATQDGGVHPLATTVRISQQLLDDVPDYLGMALEEMRLTREIGPIHGPPKPPPEPECCPECGRPYDDEDDEW
jgi:hypothetical protein